MPVTMTDVARLAGVSQTLVSAVLSGTQSDTIRYSEETRRAVLKAARQLGYRPNRTMRNVLRRRHGAVGVLVADMGLMPLNAVLYLSEVAAERDLLVTLEQISPDKRVPRLIEESCVDGLIVFEDLPEYLQERVDRARLPLVRANTNTRDASGSVVYDEAGASGLIAAHLSELGRRRPGYIFGRSDERHFSARERFEGLCTAAASFGMGEPPACWGGHEPEKTTAEIGAFLQAHPDLDSVVLYIEHLYPSLCHAAFHLGRRIPEDLAVVAYNDTVAARSGSPPLTTAAVDAHVLSKAILETVESLARGEPVPPRIVPYQLIVRQSSRKVASLQEARSCGAAEASH